MYRNRQKPRTMKRKRDRVWRVETRNDVSVLMLWTGRDFRRQRQAVAAMREWNELYKRTLSPLMEVSDAS